MMRVQGASPSGPVVWALTDALLRNARWRDDPSVFNKLGVPGERGQSNAAWRSFGLNLCVS